MNQPKISIVVPTKNSEKNLQNFLNSCVNSNFKDFEIIINDDLHTVDGTKKLVQKFSKKMDVKYIQENYSMAQGRKKGSEYAIGSILIHLDSDMQVTPDLLGECVNLITSQFDALVIPEESFGTTFWAECKWLEKKCYNGVDKVESLRCVKTELYRSVGCHNPDMVFSEDKDLDIRVRSTGANVGRTTNFLKHDEGDLKLFRTIRKKAMYSNTANLFAKAHPEQYIWQANILNRFVIYAKNYPLFFKHPFLYIGMIVMKIGEYVGSAIGLVRKSVLSTRKQFQ